MDLGKRLLIGAVVLGLAGLVAQPRRVAIVIGNSMEPTYHSGEVLLTKPLDRPLRHGDVVVVNGPDGPILKRVALLPGDCRTQWLNGTGWIDATLVGRPVKERSKARVRRLPIPAGFVFLLGDNLECSIDSRTFGPVPIESIRGLVLSGRPPAKESDVAGSFPSLWLAEGIGENRLLAHGNGKTGQPTNL
jgi:signal peptidase I